MTNTFAALILFELHISAIHLTSNSNSQYASKVLTGIDAAGISYPEACTAFAVSFVRYCVLFEKNKAVGMLMKTK